MQNSAPLTAWIAGDCWLDGSIRPFNAIGVWGEPAPSVFVVNLECAIPSGAVRPQRRALLPLDPAKLPQLALSKNTVCVLANNHVSDYGTEGLTATLEAVRRAGMLPLGAGATLGEARRPAILNVNGCRVGMLAYADTAYHVGAVAATNKDPGVAPLHPEVILSDLHALAHQVDTVWLFLHWGREYIRYPEPEQRALAFEFSKAGAELIVGVHPHVMRGTERYGKSTIYYSLGNFIFPPVRLADGPLLRWHTESRQGLALRGSLHDRQWLWEHLPYVISENGIPSAPARQHRVALLEKTAGLSAAFGEGYANRYGTLRRKELILKTARRLATMTWADRMRLPARILGRLFHRSVGAYSA
jgi:hypothetical protein